MIVTNAAVADALESGSQADDAVSANRKILTKTATASGWNIVSPQPEFSSRIMLLQSCRAAARRSHPDDLRRRFLTSNVAITAYRNGIVRASLPDTHFDAEHMAAIETVFSR
jgi:hypothetical protein